MPRTPCDEALLKQVGLLYIGVEDGLHAGGGQILRPPGKVIHRPLGSIGIIDHQAQTLLQHVVADQAQGMCRLLGEDGYGLLIAVDALAHKIIGGVVPDLQDGIRDGLAYQDEAFRQGAIVHEGPPCMRCSPMSIAPGVETRKVKSG